MHWRKRLLNNSNLYVILDAAVADYDKLFDVAQKALSAGANIFQLRDKFATAKNILDFSKRIVALLNKKALFIINDRVDLALASDCDGVHLGQEDLSCSFARKLLGKEKLIGVSCQAYLDIKKAQQQGADYIGFGSVFKTKTKPERRPMNLRLLNEALDKTKIPLFAIGGITLDNSSILIEQGVNRVAVCRAICEAQEIKKVTKNFKVLLNKGSSKERISRG